MKTTTRTGVTIGLLHGQHPPEPEVDIIDGPNHMAEFEELCEWAEWLAPRVMVGLFVSGLVLGLVKGWLS